MSNKYRVLVVAPDGRDKEVIAAMLAQAGVESEAVAIDRLPDAIEGNVFGLAIIVDTTLAHVDFARLGEALAAQPPWADFPILLLTSRGTTTRSVGRVSDQLGNVTILERPLHPDALFSAIRAALRARTRQHAAATYLEERQVAQEQLRQSAATLEERVMQRTAELAAVSVQHFATLQRVQESEELYRYTVELIMLIPWTADANGQVMTIGSRWHDLTDMALVETLGDGWIKALHADDQNDIRSLWHSVTEATKELDVDFRIRASDGDYRWYRSRAAPLFGPDGSVLRYYGTMTDVNERREAAAHLQRVQAELIQVSRLSAMGAMASTLAHELNQPLTAITNYVRGVRRLLVGSGGGSDEIIDALNEADCDAIRAGEIVRRLREMVTRGDIDRRKESVSLLIEEACRIAFIDASTLGIQYHVDHGPGVDTAFIDRIQIQQVLINLLRNAIEALSDTPNAEIFISTRAHIDGYSEVSVRDNGPGLSPDIEERLFSSFNSSKPTGMGIGLSISRTIIESHGGRIWAERNQHTGVNFRFTIPDS